jgi:hypothetical protein
LEILAEGLYAEYDGAIRGIPQASGRDRAAALATISGMAKSGMADFDSAVADRYE